MKDIQKKTEKDLVKSISDLREELRTLRFKSAGAGQRDTKSINHTKKELARGLTELNARAQKAKA